MHSQLWYVMHSIHKSQWPTATYHILVKLPWIFLGAPFTFNGAPGNIQGNLTGIILSPSPLKPLFANAYPVNVSRPADHSHLVLMYDAPVWFSACPLISMYIRWPYIGRRMDKIKGAWPHRTVPSDCAAEEDLGTGWVFAFVPLKIVKFKILPAAQNYTCLMLFCKTHNFRIATLLSNRCHSIHTDLRYYEQHSTRE